MTMTRFLSSGLASALACILLISSPQEINSRGIDRNGGHYHRGKLTQHQPGPFLSFQLNKGDEAILDKGKSVMKQIPDEGDSNSGGKAICVQDVNAPKSAVWNQILDLDHYKGKAPKLKECKNYFVKRNNDGSYNIKTKMVISVMPGYGYECYYDHTYDPKKDSVTWSLDYDKCSDFDDVAGHWHVENHPKKQGCTRVFYACDIKFRSAVPGPVMSFLTKQALKQATSWVKRESEALPTAEIPNAFAH